jgi:predicted glycosyltransferase
LSAGRVFLYVQHLLGTGHFQRSATLARALAARGLEVVLASGGAAAAQLAPAGVRLLQLDPVRAADASFRRLVDAAGNPIDERWKARRSGELLAAWRASAAHALVIELFPFGRRQMRFELLPLLETARAAAQPPVIACSVRDILGGGQHDPSRQDEMIDLFERYFDHVLVHGDPAFVPFERTFRHTARLGARLHYTGYVVAREPRAGDSRAGRGEVLVSAGGGAVGERLLETAIRCRAITQQDHRRWRVLVGDATSSQALERLTQLAAGCGDGGVVVERARGDFRSLLRNCALSVSQAGYNTTMEILDAGARAVVVPFAGGSETEQTLRARALAARGRVELVEEADLAPPRLAAAVDRAAAAPPPGPPPLDLGGAERSAALIEQWVTERAR